LNEGKPAVPGAYPFFELEIKRQAKGITVCARGALTADSVLAIDEAIATLGFQAKNHKLFIDLEEVFRFEYFAVAKLARIIKKEARHFQNLKILGAEESIIGVFKTLGIPEHCWRPNVSACTARGSQNQPGKIAKGLS